MTFNNNYEYTEKDRIDPLLICELCKDPFIDPFVTPCIHTFCRQCIEQYLESDSSCPSKWCNQSLRTEDLKPHEPGIVVSMLNRLHVKCKLCEEAPLYRGDFDEHINKDCTKAEVKCTTSKFGCTWSGERDQLNNHLKVCVYQQLSSTFDSLFDKIESQNSYIKQLEDQLEKQWIEFEERTDQQKAGLEGKIVQLKTELDERIDQQKTILEGRMDKQKTGLEEEIKKLKNKIKCLLPPIRANLTDIQPNAKWKQNGLTVAGGCGQANRSNQLAGPHGLCVDDNQTIYVVDNYNHRIMEWKCCGTNGKVVAGGNGYGNGAHQLNGPQDVIIDKEQDSFIITDTVNRRIVRWPRRKGTRGETIISNVSCWGLTMDENGFLYVVDNGKNEVRRYQIGDVKGTVVAGSNGKGNRLDQLSGPSYLFVDRDHSVYVSDSSNHRVMKWEEGTKEGIIVAGGQGEGNSLTQLLYPQGVVVDQLDTVYVADFGNHRIMRWPKGATQGTVIIGGNNEGAQSNQLAGPVGLSFDRHGNLYVVDNRNDRVQKFNIE
ncbi:unnamed protein product [Rotaria sp. Silwood1]|nr:unnamed protein product [Rotaria sp. Silwood1]